MDDIKRFLITGGTGFIGTYLRTKLLKEGHFVTVITRTPEKYKEEQAKNQKFISWDDDLTAAVGQHNVVIHLAGENLIGKRWTKKVKERAYNSRVKTAEKLTEAIAAADKKPELFISASGINFYGDMGDQVVDESHEEPGDDFLAKICRDWEAAALKAGNYGVRVAIPRIGIVAGEDGGFLEIMKVPFKLFAGGPVGSGRQYVPWVHIYDLRNALLFPVENEGFNGPYNACSPNPVRMKEFAKLVGKVMNRPSFFRVPEFAVKLVLGEAAIPVISSLNTRPAKLQENGFTFEFEDLEEALADLL